MKILKQAFFLLCCILLSSQWLHAQSRKTCFRAFNAAGQQVTVFCVNDRISFRNCDPGVNPQQTVYYYNALNSPNAFTDSLHTYSTPGTYTVIQFANLNDPNIPFGRDTAVFRVVERTPPRFFARSCTNNQVQITVTDQLYDNYELDLGTGSKIPVSRGTSTFTLPAASNRITLTGWYNGASCRVDKDTTIQALPALQAPVLERINITAAGALEVAASNLQQGYLYLLQEQNAGGTFVTLDTIRPVQAQLLHTVQNAATSSPHCYRIGVTDACRNQIGTASSTICSVVLNVQAANRQNELSWLSAGNSDLQGYTLYRDGTVLAASLSATQYTDTAVFCGRRYCYEVVAQLSGNRTSASNDGCATAVSTVAPANGFLLASFSLNNHAVLKLTPAAQETFQTMHISRNSGSGYVALSSVDQNPASDRSIPRTTASVPVNACYQVTYTDSCGLTSAPSNSSCPMILNGELPDRTQARLSWTSFEGFPQGVEEYVLELLSPERQVLAQVPVSGNSYTDLSLHPDQQILLYRIRATGTNPLTHATDTTYSNLLELVQRFEVYVPNAFSPNGDGLNDTFTAKGRFIRTFELLVYDRWGQIIYRSNDINQGWDGRINGSEATAGVYAFTIKATDERNQEFQRNGTLLLVK